MIEGFTRLPIKDEKGTNQYKYLSISWPEFVKWKYPLLYPTETIGYQPNPTPHFHHIPAVTPEPVKHAFQRRPITRIRPAVQTPMALMLDISHKGI